MSDPGPTPDELAQQQDAAREGKASEGDRGVEEGEPVIDPATAPSNTDEVDADEADLLEQSQEVPEDGEEDWR